MFSSSIRRAAVLLTAASMAVTLGSASSASPAPQETPDLCSSTGPIQAADLAQGVSTANCSLVGRLVVSGASAVVVPPEGYGVAGDGVAGPGGAEASSLQLVNDGGVVTASVDGALAPKPTPATTTARWASACSDGSYTFGSGEFHKWATTMKWHYKGGSTPKRFTKAKALKQIQMGMTNMRSGRNDCGLSGHPRATSKYAGGTSRGPNIKSRNGENVCTSFNRYNVVGFGSLAGGMLGWTCTWWSTSGGQPLIAADMKLAPVKAIVLGYSRNCSNKYDLQTVTTHEWGHAWGLGHVRNPNLTMHHFLTPCSYKLRTLGLGDFRGMKRLYGLR